MDKNKKAVGIFGIAAIMAIGALVLIMGVVSAADLIFVGPSENYTLIQQAVNVANPFDTIIVRDATYNENVDIDVDNVTIRSENGSAKCFVNASDQNDHVFDVTADNVTITGFNITGATGGGIAGIQLSCVDNCEVVDNICSDNWHGIIVFTGSNNTVYDNGCFDNWDTGIYLHWCRSNTVSDNDCSNNEYGICLIGSGSNTVSDNDCSENGKGIRLYVDCSNNSLSGNTCNSNNDHGIYLWNSSNNLIYNNYFDNTFNAYDNGNNSWNITKTAGINIIGGPNLGGNYWSDYTGEDTDDDGLGNTLLPYNASGIIVNGGDYLPLVPGENNILVAVAASNYGNTLEHDALVSTLTALGYYTIDVTNVTEAQIAGADVIFAYVGCTSFKISDLNTWISSGKGYIQLGDWTGWFSNSFEEINEGTAITVNITDPSHPVAVGLPASWQGSGFWTYGTVEDYFGWSVGYHEIGTLQAEGFPLYNEGISATTYGSGRAVYLGFNVYGSEAGPNELLLLNNTIKWIFNETLSLPFFDTGEGSYPSISGTHNGTIRPFRDIAVSTLYTYPGPGTGGHTEYVKIWNNTTGWNVTATWNGYVDDWHNLTFNNSFTLYANETYNYTIRTGSYPQIIHAPSHNATGGVITCTEFVDINGKRHEGWIPAIRLG